MILLRHLKNCWLKIKPLQYKIKIFNHWQSKCINFNLHSKSQLAVSSINSAFEGQNSISYFNSVIWNSIPAEFKGN